jgi:hypothetical protein
MVNQSFMSGLTDQNTLTYASSCSIKDAVMYLLGYSQRSIQAIWVQHSDDPSDGELLSSDGFNHLKDLLDEAESEYAEAKYDKCPDEIIAEKLAKLNECKAIIKKAHDYKSAIIDELSRDDPSLRIDKLATTNLRYPFITLLSLKSWAKDVLKISILEDLDSSHLKSSAPKSQKNIPSSDYPWWKVHQNDTPPPKSYLWFTPARYFARQYIAENPNITISKEKLAVKVAHLMKTNNIFHSGHMPYLASTIRKAFRNVNF